MTFSITIKKCDTQRYDISYTLVLVLPTILLLRLIVSIMSLVDQFALQVDPVIEFLQLGSTPFKDSTFLAPKLANPPFWWKSLTPPPLNLYLVYRSGSMHILYYLKMLIIEIELLRNQNSLCQQVFYYISINSTLLPPPIEEM
jgi:hypothetical protein